MKDEHVRYPDDPGPLVPGTRDLRYQWLPGDDPDVQRIRSQVAEGGRGLFVVGMGGTGFKALIEAYYPEDIRSEYYKKSLDRIRKVEYNMGRLVVIQEIAQYVGELHPLQIISLRRNHRNARKELKRAFDAQAFKKELADSHEKDEEPALKEWTDFYTNAVIDTVEAHKIKNTPKRR